MGGFYSNNAFHTMQAISPFSSYMDIVYLIYGAAFLGMALAIFIRQNHESTLELSGILWLLGGFGALHGILEWSDLWKVTRGNSTLLATAQPFLLLASYLFLFEFGRRMILISRLCVVPDKPDPPWCSTVLKTIIYVPLLLWLVAVSIVSNSPLDTFAILTRYTFGFFGSSMAGLGLILYLRCNLLPNISPAESLQVTRAGWLAGSAFVVYGITGGLVVPPGDFFPSNLINYPNFVLAFGLPVQLIRALCAVAIALGIGALLRIFHMEAISRLHEANMQAKRNLSQLDEYRQNLETLVQARTADLVIARDEAEIANRAKSQFLANMSHEIRTPMNAIIGLTHLLQRDCITPRQQERVKSISVAAQHLLSIINDILDLSKIESGKLQLEQADFQTQRVIDNVLSLLRDKAEAKNLLLISDFQSIPPVVHGDALRLSQILLNLISNAIKFTEHGVVSLQASVLSTVGDQIWLRFVITDTGIGMTNEQQKSIFEEFSQADTSTTRKYGGTGLGLTISQRLITLMHGKIGVESELNQGSTFWIEAPFRSATNLPKSDAGLTRPSANATPAHLDSLTLSTIPLPSLENLDDLTNQQVEAILRKRGGRILLAEDNAINQEVAEAVLADIGLQVDVAENGLIAVQKAQDSAQNTQAAPYDLILLDIQMPVMNGAIAAEQIRQIPAYATVPILSMSANTDTEMQQKWKRSGINDSVTKPVNPETLFRTILRHLMKSPRSH